MVVSTKEGNLQIANVTTPGRVEPGEDGVVKVDIQNRAKFINRFFDDDVCTGGIETGYKYKVLVRVDGEDYTTGPDCIEQGVIYESHEKEITVEAPGEDGTYDVNAKLVMPGSGEESDWMTSRLEVYSVGNAPAEGSDTSTDPWDGMLPGGGGGGGGGDGGGGSGNPFDGLFGAGDGLLAKIDLLILAIAGLGSAYALGQLFDIQLGGGAAT